MAAIPAAVAVATELPPMYVGVVPDAASDSELRELLAPRSIGMVNIT